MEAKYYISFQDSEFIYIMRAELLQLSSDFDVKKFFLGFVIWKMPLCKHNVTKFFEKNAKNFVTLGN